MRNVVPCPSSLFSRLAGRKLGTIPNCPIRTHSPLAHHQAEKYSANLARRVVVSFDPRRDPSEVPKQAYKSGRTLACRNRVRWAPGLCTTDEQIKDLVDYLATLKGN